MAKLKYYDNDNNNLKFDSKYLNILILSTTNTNIKIYYIFYFILKKKYFYSFHLGNNYIQNF